MGKFATGTMIAVGAGLAAYGFYEAGSGLVHTFNSISSPETQTLVKGLSAAFGAVVGGGSLGTIAAKNFIEIKGAVLTLVFGALGAIGGGIGGWEIAAHHLPQTSAHSSTAIVQPAPQQTHS